MVYALMQSPSSLTNEKRWKEDSYWNCRCKGLLVMALLALGVAVLQEKKKSTKLLLCNPADDITTAGYLQFDIKEIEYATKKKISQGGFGQVYKASGLNY